MNSNSIVKQCSKHIELCQKNALSLRRLRSIERHLTTKKSEIAAVAETLSEASHGFVFTLPDAEIPLQSDFDSLLSDVAEDFVIDQNESDLIKGFVDSDYSFLKTILKTNENVLKLKAIVTNERSFLSESAWEGDDLFGRFFKNQLLDIKLDSKSRQRKLNKLNAEIEDLTEKFSAISESDLYVSSIREIRKFIGRGNMLIGRSNELSTSQLSSLASINNLLLDMDGNIEEEIRPYLTKALPQVLQDSLAERNFDNFDALSAHVNESIDKALTLSKESLEEHKRLEKEKKDKQELSEGIWVIVFGLIAVVAVGAGVYFFAIWIWNLLGWWLVVIGIIITWAVIKLADL